MYFFQTPFRRLSLLAGLVGAFVLLLYRYHVPQSNSEYTAPDPSGATTLAVTLDNSAIAEKSVITEEGEKRLLALEAKLKQKAELINRSQQARMELLSSAFIQYRWQAFLKTVLPEIKREMQQGKDAGYSYVKCPVCNETNTLDFCLGCNENNGVCSVCFGSGTFFGETCATCLGSGICFLCAGDGAMGCKFCSDGEMPLNQLLPSQTFIELFNFGE